MIDRELVAKIANHAITAYLSSTEPGFFGGSRSDAVLATVDEFTPEPSHDDIEAEIDAINAMYLAQNARQAVVHWMRGQWAKERIAWRKEREANSR